MKEKETKKFELNTKMLENFDTILSTKLDEIDELKVTGLDKGSKLLNIISLCANLKTLIIEGDQRLNPDRILANLFKPEELETLILSNVKIPSASSLKRYTNLKNITLQDIRFCQVKDFFAGIVNPEKVEVIHISNIDMHRAAVTIFEKFTSVKELKLENLKNIKLKDLQFLKNNNHLLKVNLIDNPISITELDHLVNSHYSKNIVAPILGLDGKLILNSKFKIKKDIAEIVLPIHSLEVILKSVDLYKLNKVSLVINEIPEETCYIDFLKKFKNELHIILNDFSCLSVEEAQKIKDIAKISHIEFASKKGITKYSLEEYIDIRTEIENTIENIAKQETEPEKFLQIYQILGNHFSLSEKTDLANGQCTTFQLCQILQNCLKCVGIESNMIFGEELENDKKHYWNQVKLDGKWYHVDLGLDLENIKKNKVEYCLLGDKDFLETHTPRSGKNHYASENYNPKLIHVFFKTGLFREKLLTSYIEIMIEKIKKLFHFNKKQEILALPEAETTENEEEQE